MTCPLLPAQILEVPVTSRDVEREHHSQLKRWRKNRGELNFKSPPRMHGARLILLAEPPRRQDLEQNPTILLEMPTPQRSKEEKKSGKKKKSVKKSKPVEDIPNPYSLPTDPKPPPPPPDTPAPPPLAGGEASEEPPPPQTESDSPPQQQEPPAAIESPLQQSQQSLSSTEHDTYL